MTTLLSLHTLVCALSLCMYEPVLQKQANEMRRRSPKRTEEGTCNLQEGRGLAYIRGVAGTRGMDGRTINPESSAEGIPLKMYTAESYYILKVTCILRHSV